MATLQNKHLELVQSVNEAKTHVQHRDAENKLSGFREALSMIDPRGYASYLMDCDMHYIEQGVDRPMCCGVFLDWRPAQ